MARLPRIHLPDLPAHVVVRGNDRKALFRSEGDRIFFHRCLMEASWRYGLEIHAYVLMTNHVHLVATGEHALSLSRSIQMVGRRYVSYFNYLYGRTGSLWEGRFRSSPIQSDRYLLACHRYVEMNPVRAGIVSAPGDFLWSSHGALAFGKCDDLITPHPIYLGLELDGEIRFRRYRQLFEKRLSPGTLGRIRKALNAGLALGSRQFCRQLELESGRRVTTAKMGRPPRSKSQSENSALELN